MHGLDAHGSATAEPLEALGAVRPLCEMEQALLSVLDNEFISTTVVKDRARLKVRAAAPILSRRMLSGALLVAPILCALRELEQRGLAERLPIGRCTRWRRAQKPGDLSAPGVVKGV